MRHARLLFLSILFVSLFFLLNGCDGDDGNESLCGNGIKDAGEECDPKSTDRPECESYGYPAGTVGCTADCKLDFSYCVDKPATCGNGVVEPGEECDGESFAVEGCGALGYDGGTLACNSSCLLVLDGCFVADATADDDLDGVSNGEDNCPDKYNPEQTDADGDGWGDFCDNCPDRYNATQLDDDGDGIGDACELDADPNTDFDSDGVPNVVDDCPEASDPEQLDSDMDGIGDACDQCPMDPGKAAPGECGCGSPDADSDGDGVLDCNDPCPTDRNDLCNSMGDRDGDGVPDASDICPWIHNPEQDTTDRDNPGIPDECEFVQVCAGGSHTCAVTAAGFVHCWGRNDRGQLGSGFTFDSTSEPQPVVVDGGAPLQDVVSVECGMNHTCALVDPDGDGVGEIWCWGSNSDGQLGPGCMDDFSDTAVRIAYQQGAPVEDAVDVSTTMDHVCMVASQGGANKVYCWGLNIFGQVDPDSDSRSINVPTLVKKASDDTTLLNASMVSTGASHSCALVEENTKDVAYCWGTQEDGRLGNGVDDSEKSWAVKVKESSSSPLEGVESISSGYDHSCAVVSEGLTARSVRCWGRNNNGETGTQNDPTLFAAFKVKDGPASEIKTLRWVSAGNMFTCAAGSLYVYCWGINDRGQLSQGTQSTSDQVNQYALKVYYESGKELFGGRVSAGAVHACAIAGGHVWCWGGNDWSQVGVNGATMDFAVYAQEYPYPIEH